MEENKFRYCTRLLIDNNNHKKMEENKFRYQTLLFIDDNNHKKMDKKIKFRHCTLLLTDDNDYKKYLFLKKISTALEAIMNQYTQKF